MALANRAGINMSNKDKVFGAISPGPYSQRSASSVPGTRVVGGEVLDDPPTSYYSIAASTTPRQSSPINRWRHGHHGYQ